MIYSIQRYCIHDGDGIRTTIFFKGCQLRCPWCANPESQLFTPEIGYYKSKCVKCGICIKVCPRKAISENGINRELCDGCGICADYCEKEALQLFGKEYSIDELMKEVIKDKRFFDSSGGGVTLSGGEAILQEEYVFELLSKLKMHNIDIALESNACFGLDVGKRLLPYIDQYLLDLKHFDDEVHKKVLGVSNINVIENIILASKKDLTIRIPLIPGFNDDDENLKHSAQLAKRLNCKIDVLGYHNFGSVKYEALGREYLYKKLKRYDEKKLGERKEYVRSFGVEVV
jgi:pyruvate formate lyase activating enzyme